jgi:dihydrolipoamide dehydrogenase
LDTNTVEVTGDGGEKLQIWAKDFVIATGSRPREYEGFEVDNERIINSDGVLDLKAFPERMVIIGSGIIGCEFATIFSNFGQTEVHMIDRYNRVIPFEDDDLSDFVAANLAANGVQIHHTASLRTIRKQKTHLEVVLDYTDGHSRVIEADVALVAIGRIPNTDDLGLEKLGLTTTERGFLKINDVCRVGNNPHKSHIFAAGDITGHGQLYNVAETQGRYAAKAIYNQIKYPLTYSNMSTLMFFKPEVAAVGANEKELQQGKHPYRVAYYANEMVNRSIAMRNTNGFVKIMISDTDDQRILGMRAAGPQASAFIVSVAHLIDKGNTLKDIMKIIHPHPSVTEGIQECIRVFSQKSVMKPKAFPDLISLRRWSPEHGMELLS